MKFKVTVTATYEVPDANMMRVYGTTDPHQAAAIDERNDPLDFLELFGFDVSMKITPEVGE